MEPYRALIGAFLIWGLSPLFWMFLSEIPTDYVLANRIVWSFFLLFFVLSYKKRIGELSEVFATKKSIALTFTTSILLALNWLTYIYAIQIGRTWEASLGYYILPLLSVFSGRILFHEKINRIQWSAVALAAITVGVLTIQLGKPPIITLTVACSFAIYSILHKGSTQASEVSLLGESLFLFPLTVFYLGFIAEKSNMYISSVDSILLLSTAIVSLLPLFLFTYAVKKVPLNIVGMGQYSVPTLQLLSAYFVLGEKITMGSFICFCLIWIAITLYFIGKSYGDRTEN